MNKVYKKEPDAVTSMAGEGMQVDEGGEFFMLSDACKEVVSHHPNLIWPESEEPAAEPAEEPSAPITEPAAEPAAAEGAK